MALAPAVGTVSLTPIYIPNDLPISALWTYCNNANPTSPAVLHLGLYSNEGSTFTREIAFGTVSGAGLGVKQIAGSWTLPAGVHWMAWLFVAANATFAGTTRPRIPGPLLAGAGVMDPHSDMNTMQGPIGQSTLPASFTGTTMVTSVPIRFAVKVS